MADSSESIFVDDEDGIAVIHKNVKVDGNAEVVGQLSTRGFKVIGEDLLPIMSTQGDTISFKKACDFRSPVQFNNGRTLIGIETTYNSAYVGTETIQAGKRVVVGDSLFKITADERAIIADTFRMTLSGLKVDTLMSKKETSDLAEFKKVKVTNELIGEKIYADVIKTNSLYIDSIGSRNLQATETMTVKDLIVGGTAKVQNDVFIMGVGVNGAALTVNGGGIVANKGIVSHTRNNRFQTMEIMGSGPDPDICFVTDKNVDALFQGNVTIQDAKLILENTKLATDEVLVTPLAEVAEDEHLSGVQITSKGNWEDYRDSMVQEFDAQESASDEDYDPVDVVNKALERNEANYVGANLTVKTVTDPISYLMEQNNPLVPKRFVVKSGIYRVDHNGHALVRDLTAEKAKFSDLEAYKFKVNQLHVDKLVTTGVASNVVDTDNLLKSRGIAEFDGSVNVAGDVFMEEGSKMNVADGAQVTFQDGATLKLRNGAKFEMGNNTAVKMSGDIELDLSKLVFVDSVNGGRYKISFREAHECEGNGIVMDYEKLADEETSREIVVGTALDAKELDEKLKSLDL